MYPLLYRQRQVGYQSSGDCSPLFHLIFFDVRYKRQAQESDPSALTQKLGTACCINNFELQKMQ